MDKLYIATMIRKRKIENGKMYICDICGIIVGLLFGTTFLSSRSKKYKPMLNTKIGNIEGLTIITKDMNLNNFLLSNEKYAYYNLIEVNNFDNIEKMIEEEREKYKDISYFINLDSDIPYIIKYKKNSN